MNNTLANGLRVLELLAESETPYSVKDVAASMQIPNSHACRLLKTLSESGYVEQEAKGRKYKISLKALTLSNNTLKRLGIRAKLRPFLLRLSRDLNAATYLSLPYQGRPMIIDATYPESATLDTGVTIGSINPLHASASGKVCAAWQPKEILEAILSKESFQALTQKTITTSKRFREELIQVRKEKVATTDSERSSGLGAAAAPVFDCEGEFIAIIGSAFQCEGFTQEHWQNCKDKVRSAAEAASFALGYARYDLVQ
ncbi:MAG: hypothetical protein A2X49_05960 [Lentisphaerae bacterium GWF2_52_8]|nr:MAG: hypothetical protein A2X49_05960 [Lentisphaerae bacterium GWF2_52_8]